MQNNIEHKDITLDDLALMVNKGFKEARNDLVEFKEEVRKEFVAVREELGDVREEITYIRRGILTTHSRRLRKIENKLQIA